MRKGKLISMGPHSCGSSDALATYDDGHAYCFSCNAYVSLYKDNNKNMNKDILEDNISSSPLSSSIYAYASLRSIRQETFEKYGVKAKMDDKGNPISVSFPFGSYTQVRVLKEKDFSMIGNADDVRLFGQDIFVSGSAQAITITEGAFDALSAYEMLGSQYPVVSIRSVVTAARDCKRSFDYLNSFKRIYICMDADEHGQRAAKEIAGLFDPNKVFHVKLERYKDANEFLQAGDRKSFVNLWWAAKKYMPKGIVGGTFDEIKKILATESAKSIATYPFPTLNSIAYGIRSGELVLLTALEKVGKTEILRAIEHHLLKTTEENVGIIHLEEKEDRSVKGLVSYEIGVPCHLPGNGVSLDDQFKAYQDLVKRENRVHYYTHFGSDDPDNILDTIRYLVAVQGCKFIFLDHITMLVTGFEGDDERKTLDYISTRLAMLTRELDFTLFLVSHVNDSGQTRGSRNIAKVADLLLHLDRDIEAASEDERNTTVLVCRGNRFAGATGPAGRLIFNPKTYTITEKLDPPTSDYDYKSIEVTR